MARRTDPKFDPYGNFSFLLEIDGITSAGFSECTGTNAEISPIEYREGNESLTPRKLPGLNKFGNVTLKRGVTEDMDLFNWFNVGASGDVDRKQTLSIVLLDEQRNEAVRWNLLNAWPCKYMAPDLKGSASEIAIESVELCHEGLIRQTP
jgi:phage tail-like protein